MVDNNVMHARVGLVGHLAAIAREGWCGLIYNLQKLLLFFFLDFLELTFLSHRFSSHLLDLPIQGVNFFVLAYFRQISSLLFLLRFLHFFQLLKLHNLLRFHDLAHLKSAKYDYQKY